MAYSTQPQHLRTNNIIWAFYLRHFILRALALLSCLLLIYACKKETHLPAIADKNFNKGIGFQEDFEPISTDWLYYNTDTVSSNVVKFIALDSFALSYTWTIESATYNTREVRLKFPVDYLQNNRQLTVKLSIRYLTNSNSDTVKTFSKLLTFVNPCDSKCNGVFKGTTDNSNQADSFKIETCAKDQLHPVAGFYLENYQLQCRRYFDELPDIYNIGYKQILFSATGEYLCNSPSGIISIYGDSIFISYRSFDNGLLEAPLDHIFRGVKK